MILSMNAMIMMIMRIMKKRMIKKIIVNLVDDGDGDRKGCYKQHKNDDNKVGEREDDIDGRRKERLKRR